MQSGARRRGQASVPAAPPRVPPPAPAPGNIARQLSVREGEGQGRRARRMMGALERRLDEEHWRLPSAIAQLQRHIAARAARELRTCLLALNRKLLANALEADEATEMKADAVLFGLPEALVAIIRASAESAEERAVAESGLSLWHELQVESLSLLRELCFAVPSYARGLALDAPLMVALFGRLREAPLFDHVVALLEEILCAGSVNPYLPPDTFDLAAVPDVLGLIGALSGRQLAFFCRLLVLLIFEPQERQLPAALKAAEAPRAEGGVALVERNQELLLSQPWLLDRLITLLHLQHVVPPGSNLYTQMSHADLFQLFTGHEDAAEWAELRAQADAALALAADAAAAPTPPAQLSFRDLTMAVHQIELLFSLCALLTGKRRAHVQDAMAARGVVRSLSRLFDAIDWRPLAAHEHVRPHNSPNCECGPETAMRVQFLRVLLNLCDRDSPNLLNKLLLLTPAELATLDLPPAVRAEAEARAALGCAGSEGIAVKLIKQFMRQPRDSSLRFWFASALEAFFRGGERHLQLFAVRHGLLDHLVAELVADDAGPAAAMLPVFDLLGELLKFNPAALAQLSQRLGPYQLDKLTALLASRLVDSNVFVRSIMLTTAAAAAEGVTLRDDRLVAWFERERTRLLRDLMECVSVDGLTQENICCLNTTLIGLVLVARNGPAHLAAFVERLWEGELEAGREPRRLFENFAALTRFWRSYYRTRRRDCDSLQFSSRIPFAEWTATHQHVSALLAHHLAGEAPPPPRPT